MGNDCAEILWKVRTKKVILATGAVERPLIFANNDRPGVMLAAAAVEYAQRYGVGVGRRVVIFTNNNYGYKSVLALQQCGIDVALVVDPRPDREIPDAELGWLDKVRAAGVPIQRGSAIVDVRGRKRVTHALVAPLTDEKADLDHVRSVSCDAVLHSGGWVPRVQLFAQSGGKLVFDKAINSFVPSLSQQDEISVGGANGTLSIAAGMQEGMEAGIGVCKALGVVARPPLMGSELSNDLPEGEQDPFFRAPMASPQTKAWVDLQNDVTTTDIELAARENYVSVEHLKRYTTLGMATDQGKTSNLNGLSLMAQARGLSVGEVGTTKFRPPYDPVSFGAIAGRRVGQFFNPLRRLPTDLTQRNLKGYMEDWGGWSRPSYYPQAGEMPKQAIHREVAATRNHVGIFEGSPLGKIEVKGPDAGESLNRIFVNTASTLKTGKARYGIIADENGIVFDDGVFVRLCDDTFLCSTTSGGASHVYEWMEEWLQCEWTGLEVYISNVTTCWATFAVAGPKARAVLSELCRHIDLGRDAMPHMSCVVGTIADVPARIFRVSFTGEMSFEVNVPAHYGEHVWQAIMDAGQEHGITPYGVEANLLMRAEKGYLHVGADTDGVTVPQDIGYGGPVQKKKSDFIGRRSMVREDAMREDRLQYVGIRPVDQNCVLTTGAHIVQTIDGVRKSEGYVTSSYWSPTLQHGIALGRVQRGRDRMGERITIFDKGKLFDAEITSPVFYDPKGERLAG
ncbi:MAG: glycine cleavage T C-terminal barrel domain-containing protein [Pseudomonadota bacterium]